MSAGAHSSSEKSAGYQKSIKGGGQEKSTSDVKYGGVEMLIYHVGKMALKAAFKKASQGAAELKEAEQDKRRLDLSIDDKTGLPLKDKVYTRQQDIKYINPGFKNASADTKHNCSNCVTAYELRRRGYDVRAGKRFEGRTAKEISKFYKENKQFNRIEFKGRDEKHTANAKEKANQITNELLTRSGNNTRGTIAVRWISGGGHVFNYDIYDGKVHYFDGQDGREYTNFVKTASRISLSDCSFLRTDNLTPDYELLKKEKVIA